MDARRYDILHTLLLKISKQQTDLISTVDNLKVEINSLTNKTIVVSEVNTAISGIDKKLSDLQQEMTQIKDEVIA